MNSELTEKNNDLLEENKKLSYLKDLDKEIGKQEKEYDRNVELLEELEDNVKEMENRLGINESYEEFLKRTVAEVAKLEALKEENEALERNIKLLRNEIDDLRPRLEFFRSEAFKTDMFVKRYTERFNTGENASMVIPEPIQKYKSMMVPRKQDAVEEDMNEINRMMVAVARTIRPQLANDGTRMQVRIASIPDR